MKTGAFILSALNVAGALGISIFSATADVEGDEKAEEIVADVSELLQPDKSFTLRAKIDSYRDRKAKGSIELRSYVRVTDSAGAADAVSVVLSPDADRGKVFLQKEAVFWLYAPGAKRPVKVSAGQRLMGDVTLADMSWFDLRNDYAAELGEKEDIVDADGETASARRIVLTAKTNKAPYPVLRLWVKGITRQPVKVECVSDSNRVLKTIFYGRFRGLLGKSRPSELTVVDNTVAGRVTRIRFSDFAYRSLEDIAYTPEAMPSVSDFADAEK